MKGELLHLQWGNNKVSLTCDQAGRITFYRPDILGTQRITVDAADVPDLIVWLDGWMERHGGGGVQRSPEAQKLDIIMDVLRTRERRYVAAVNSTSRAGRPDWPARNKLAELQEIIVLIRDMKIE